MQDPLNITYSNGVVQILDALNIPIDKVNEVNSYSSFDESCLCSSNEIYFADCPCCVIPLTDWAQNAHSLTVQRGQNAHYVPSLYRVSVVCSCLHGL